MMNAAAWIPALLLCLAGCATAASGDAAPPPEPDELPLKDAVSQYGITWRFDKPVPVGRFVTGDTYVVGPVTVLSVTPAPVGQGADFRNGSMLNPPTTPYSAYDGRFRNTFQQNLAARFPLKMKPGDSLVSAVSLDKVQQNKILPNRTRSAETSPLRTAAVLTCLARRVPADAFRPSYCDLKKDRIRRAGDIQWERLPSYKPADGAPKLADVERMFQRPWIDHVYDWSSRTLHPSENLPGYGREIGRAVSLGALMLCCDFTREQKETLCLRFIQVGIDNWGVARRGKVREAGGWPAAGGFGNGRKLPIVFAAVLLQDDQMLHIKKNAPETCFGEDQHVEFGMSWTGAKVRFTGQYPLIGDKQIDRGPYEHLHPSKWPGKRATMSEGYRRCCTSICWVGQALALRMIKAEKVWDHDAFFPYVDRWMHEDDTKFREEIAKAHPSWRSGVRQGTTVFDPWIDKMWAAHRPAFKPDPTTSWK